VDTEPLGPDGMVGHQRFGNLRVFHNALYLFAYELLTRLVRLEIGDEIAEGAEIGEPAIRPLILVDTPAFLLANAEGRCLAERAVDIERGLRNARTKAAIVGLDARLFLAIERLVVRRDRIGGGALKDGEMLRLACDERNGLHGR